MRSLRLVSFYFGLAFLLEGQHQESLAIHNNQAGGTLDAARIQAAVGARAVAAGREHSIALASDGTVWAWGNGNLGGGSYERRNAPGQVTALSGVLAVDGGPIHALALMAGGTVWAWGDNEYGQLGDGTEFERTVPVRSGELAGIIAVAAGSLHSLALKENGTVWAAAGPGERPRGRRGDRLRGRPRLGYQARRNSLGMGTQPSRPAGTRYNQDH